MASLIKRPLHKTLIFLHKWLGVSLALLFLMWFVSGVVLYFVPFPSLTQTERLAGLPPLQLPKGCCMTADQAAGSAGLKVSEARLGMHDGKAVRSCVYPASAAAKGQITTLEGLGSVDKLHALQKAFIDEQAAQCGYCISGMIMTAKALLDKVRNPRDNEIREAMANNLCRCGTHTRILSAIARAAKEMA